MYCSQCGQKISENANFCQNCGNNIEETVSHDTPYTSPYLYVPNNNSTPKNIYTPPAPTYTKKKISRRNPFLIVVLAFVMLGFVLGIVNTVKYAVADSNLTPVSEPKSGTILSGTEYYNGSEITVTASSGESCVVKLKTSSDVEVLSFYVRAGETVTVGVPNKYLYVYFASGDTWYGNDDLFGNNTHYSKVQQIKNFVDYAWKYELQKSSNGNLDTVNIDANEFK